MRTNRAKLVTAISTAAILVVACSSDEEATNVIDSGIVGNGGDTGTGGAGTGGRIGGTGGSTVGTGGTSTGGAFGNTGGALGGTGGASSGGASGAPGTGGTGTGGAGTGGTVSDASTDGAGTGGAGTGGAGTGGAGTGGAGTGGAGTGGTGTGGAGTGGAGADAGAVHKRVFITSVAYTAAQVRGSSASGPEGADQLCAQHATAASLGGTWKAWLSDNSTNAIDRIADVGPWYRIDGQKVFNNKAALTGNPLVPINIDENAATVTDFFVQHPWTGTKADGTKATALCDNWSLTSTNLQNGECGVATATNGTWTEDMARPCGVPYSLYCFEQ